MHIFSCHTAACTPGNGDICCQSYGFLRGCNMSVEEIDQFFERSRISNLGDFETRIVPEFRRRRCPREWAIAELISKIGTKNATAFFGILGVAKPLRPTVFKKKVATFSLAKETQTVLKRNRILTVWDAHAYSRFDMTQKLHIAAPYVDRLNEHLVRLRVPLRQR